jgi:hypothetical protein
VGCRLQSRPLDGVSMRQRVWAAPRKAERGGKLTEKELTIVRWVTRLGACHACSPAGIVEGSRSEKPGKPRLAVILARSAANLSRMSKWMFEDGAADHLVRNESFQLNVAHVEWSGEQVGGRRGIRRELATTVPLRRSLRECNHTEYWGSLR